MGKIVIDNWTLEYAVKSLETVFEGVPTYNKPFINFVESIVLWDKIYYWKNGRECSWMSHNAEAVKELSSAIEPVEFDSKYILSSILPYFDVLSAEGAVEYYNACTNNGFSYLAIEKRAKFLQRYLSGSGPLDRRFFSEFFDNKVMDKYPEITDAVYNQPIVYHSIFNRVLANARNPQNIIQAALELRQSKDACAFRNYMDIIENKRIDKLNKSIISITKDINRLFKDKDESNGLITEIKISLPYLTLETRLPDLDPIFDIFTNRKLNFFKTMLDDVKRRDIANRYNSRR